MNPTPPLQLPLPMPQPVAGTATFEQARNSRKLFWTAFLDWLAVATVAESDQLERTLAPHAPHVRPLVAAVSDALHDPQTARLLPPTLLAQLVATGWKPEPRPAARRAA